MSRDARLSVRQLAERVHVSRTAAHTRLQNLTDTGVITGFAAQVNRKALGLHISAVVVVKVGDVPWPEISSELAALPFVEKVQAVSGDVDALVTVNAPDHDQLSQVILRKIHEVHGVLSTRSLLILEEIPGTVPGTAGQ
ncbi:Lrp/AsnC family transcriptional regulator [Saxibacter everestensis]|uniref:Lrp/AsnC family transcriptional regulator n=1 Tax=Saxibacter everestensis TaxID=2909229 RepID=A0ABY8QQB8_9MICO|nr:Lrp/AsnC family transcriptional regulator [Brevibacteriaceae bacterium ZFBP1038]